MFWINPLLVLIALTALAQLRRLQRGKQRLSSAAPADLRVRTSWAPHAAEGDHVRLAKGFAHYRGRCRMERLRNCLDSFEVLAGVCRPACGRLKYGSMNISGLTLLRCGHCLNISPKPSA